MRPVYLLITPSDCHGAELVISGEQYHHLVRVKRLSAGALLCAVLPDGRRLHAEISAITADTLHARITSEEQPGEISPCRITLYQSMLKGEKMDSIIRKAGELGVNLIIPLLAQNSVPRWSPAQARARAERWQRIADSAAEQCERGVPMHVETPRTQSHLGALPALTLLLHEREGESLRALAQREPAANDIGLLLGPEGGWVEEEVAAFHAAGALPIHLGRRILRAETASIAAITLVQFLWGDLA